MSSGKSSGPSAEPANLFDHAHYAGVRKPLLEAETMPVWAYTSEAFYKREVESIFMKVWNFLGRVEQVARPGDYFAATFAGVPLIVIRGDDGEVRAFANTCRHRGSELLEGKGQCKAIICPYHSWTYALDGRLVGLGRRAHGAQGGRVDVLRRPQQHHGDRRLP